MQLLIKTIRLKIHIFLAFKLCDVALIMLIHVKMQTVFKIEHENSCITSKQIFINSASFYILLKSGKPRPPRICILLCGVILLV